MKVGKYMGKEKKTSVFGTVHIENKHSAGAIGIISGACGPEIDEAVRKQNEFYDRAAKIIKPCERSFDEIEHYLIEKYGAVEYIPSESEVMSFKSNVIHCNFPHVIERTIVIDEDSSIEDLIRSIEIDKPIEQSINYPAEKLGLEMMFYTFSKKDKNVDKVIKVKIEKKSEYISIDCDNEYDNEIAIELITFTGVSEKDIKEKTDRFKAYASLQRELGKIKVVEDQ